MWTCAQCGEENPDSAAFCEVCARPAPAGERSGPDRREAPAPVRGPPAVPAPAPGYSPPDVGEPPPATMFDGHGDRRRPAFPVIPVAGVALLALVMAGAFLAPRLLGDDPAAAPTFVPPTTTAPVQPPVETTTTEPGGITEPSPAETSDPGALPAAPVTVDPAITDSRATGVATMFETYFSGINDKDYDRVGTVLDPAGSLDPADPADMRDLADGTRSTQDSEVTLNGLSDLPGGRVRADVSFVSRQEPGDGPKGRPGETCTRWTMIYTLTTAGDGTYRIRKTKASAEPC
jgi:hypothetical protein